MSAVASSTPSSAVLTSLRSICDAQGLEDLAGRIADAGDLVRADMREVERAIDGLSPTRDAIHDSAVHLLGLGGKRLRPMCVALASRLGTGFSEGARELAVSVELVHTATLLHDDVVDVADARRSAPTARVLYGNAASIYAGDYLLIEALRRVTRVGLPGVLEKLLDVVESMIEGEALQLERRGRLDTDRETYFRIVEGKTAALFRWAMLAGGSAGGVVTAHNGADLEAFGVHLGMAFQLIDDLLDYDGEAARIGKIPFADLREGKATYPLIVASERDDGVRTALARVVAGEADPDRALLDRIRATGAFDTTRALALDHADRAARALDGFSDGRAKDALLTLARATVLRDA